ncbi:hypothetical protein [Ligilactobacillus equi]|uniref:Uncharacterized protein n=1 Tax=Ligilactobacillus equi DSM 15833 = JCM 10991 TaxID=1423740 RepID=A0A0R1TA24_9LACO|nr:hypothetical protein [Ligilactobacillus equi]KRL78246.1 hypothetical protein FC36_GL001134 [Ligilactobacillus equi DSM 15833 = JCM 10991]
MSYSTKTTYVQGNFSVVPKQEKEMALFNLYYKDTLIGIFDNDGYVQKLNTTDFDFSAEQTGKILEFATEAIDDYNSNSELTYDGFKRLAEELGFECYGDERICSLANVNGKICIISKITPYAFSTMRLGFELLTNEQKEKVMDLARKLAQTPLERRYVFGKAQEN